MERIDRLHPITIFIYFICAILPAMFSMNPLMQIISVIGAVTLYLPLRTGRGMKDWLFLGMFSIVILVVHPLFNHNGKTVLFYLNGNRITFEAMMYAIVMACMMFGILLWCKSLSLVMTSDRIIYLFGRVSKKAALICAMVLRFVPMFHKQMTKTRESQKLLGLYRENSLIDKVRAELYLFSAMVTWSFEHSMDTADSMQARGYGSGKRTQYSQYKIRRVDIELIVIMSVNMIMLLMWMGAGVLEMTYYPIMIVPDLEITQMAAYAAYLVLCLLLPGYQLWGNMRKGIKQWKYTR